MKNEKNAWKSITVIAIVLYVLAIALVVTATASPKSLSNTNVRHIGFTVSWITDVDEIGQVNYGTDPDKLINVADDDRGVSISDDTHHITITWLTPENDYYYDIVSGGITYDNGGSHFKCRTGPGLGLTIPDQIYGQVYKSDGSTPAEGTIVYIIIEDNDGIGSAGESQVLSCLVESHGYWWTDIGSIRTDDSSSYFTYSSSGDNVKIFAQGGRDGTASLTLHPDEALPAADMVLAGGKPMLNINVSLKSGWNLISAPLNLTSWELGDESVVGDPLNVTPKNSITSIYRYNTTSGLFEKCDHFDDWGWWQATGSESFTKLEPGKGYWVMAKNDCNLTFTGTAPSDLNITLNKSWNLVGWYSLSEALLGEESAVGNPLNVTPKNSLTSIYRYNTTSGLFEKCDHFDDWGWWQATGSENFTKLEPGRGYWVMANNDCEWRHEA